MALVRSGSTGAQELAVQELSGLMIKNADNQDAVARAGAIEPLVALLRSGSAWGQEEAAWALGHLAANADNRGTIA